MVNAFPLHPGIALILDRKKQTRSLRQSSWPSQSPSQRPRGEVTGPVDIKGRSRGRGSWLQILGREQGKGKSKVQVRGRHCCRQETTDRCSSPSPAVLSYRISEPPRGPCGRSTGGTQVSRSRSRNIPERVLGGRLVICIPHPSSSAGTKIATRIGPSPLFHLLQSPPLSCSRSRRYVVFVGRLLLLFPEDNNQSIRDAQYLGEC